MIRHEHTHDPRLIHVGCGSKAFGKKKCYIAIRHQICTGDIVQKMSRNSFGYVASLQDGAKAIRVIIQAMHGFVLCQSTKTNQREGMGLSTTADLMKFSQRVPWRSG